MVESAIAGEPTDLPKAYLDRAYSIYQMEDGTVCMIADSGCKRSVAGPKWHARMTQACHDRGLKPQRREVGESSKFGDGDVVYATESYVYPIGIYGARMGKLDVAYIDRDCPGLMSRGALRDGGDHPDQVPG